MLRVHINIQRGAWRKPLTAVCVSIDPLVRVLVSINAQSGSRLSASSNAAPPIQRINLYEHRCQNCEDRVCRDGTRGFETVQDAARGAQNVISSYGASYGEAGNRARKAGGSSTSKPKARARARCRVSQVTMWSASDSKARSSSHQSLGSGMLGQSCLRGL